MPRRKQYSSTTSGNSEGKRTRNDEDDQHDSSLSSSKGQKKVRWGTSIDPSEDDELEDGTESGSSITNKVCFAGSAQFGRIGCAYYDPVKCIIYAFEDVQENQHLDLTKALLEQCNPDIAFASSKADDSFIDILRDTMDTSGGTFQIRPHKDFSPAKGRDRMLSLRLLSELPMENPGDNGSLDDVSSSEPRDAYSFMRRRRAEGSDPLLRKWNALIRLANFATVDNSPLCLGSIGALLDQLVRIGAVGDLDGEGIGGLDIRAIQPFTLTQSMQINTDALFSLQIFEDETHASIHSDKTKEGLSLFGVLNTTRTTLGRALMRDWLFRPSLSIPVIEARHDAVACFTRPDNLTAASEMQGHLTGIKNIPRILGIMRAGRAKVSDWQALVKFSYHSFMLRNALADLNQAGNVEIVKRLMHTLDVASFKEIGRVVNETIDWEESSNASRICVRPYMDEELDNMKHIYNGIDSVLSKVAEQLSLTVPPDYASSLNVVYFPQLGFLICIPMLDEWKTDQGITVLDGWTFQFSSESHVYFKSQEMHDMDVHIGDVHPFIVDREIEIVQSLLERVLKFDEAMGTACDVCAELDCLLSFAEASSTGNYVRPQMTEENIIHIKQGRHPLQELVVDQFVPNDAYIIGGAGIGTSSNRQNTSDSDESDRQQQYSIIVCTGSNACGKSVYLKQVALIQYMAQIGCFVPAESATLGIVDKIFTRIQTRESVSKVQSAFMIDLNQVSLALRNSTERSLILLDEFGKGTVSADGAGLFCGVLKHLAYRGPSCPKVLAATHFHDVFTEDLLAPRSLPITFVHMQVLLTTPKGNLLGISGSTEGYDNEDGEDENTDADEVRAVAPGERITYLYRVAPGLCLDSHAALCAEIFGIPRRLTKRARYVSNLLSKHELGRLLDEEMSEGERRDLEDAEEVCRQFLAWNLIGDGEAPYTKGDVREVLMQVLGREA